MPNAAISFPKWEEVLSGLIEQYRHRIDLPESIFEDAYVLVKQTSSTKADSIDHQAAFDKSRQFIPREIINELLASKTLESNQFLTLSRSDSSILWSDDRAHDLLNIPYGSLRDDQLMSWYKSPILYHPMDALHLMRYHQLIHELFQLHGALNGAKDFFFRLRFRMVIAKQSGNERTHVFKHIDRKSSPIEDDRLIEISEDLWLDVWTISNDYEGHKDVETNIEVMDDHDRTKFLNMLLYLFNAKSLGFNPKDIVVINYNNLYDGPEEGRASLNRALRMHHENTYEFEVKPYTDSSYYLNKKLTSSLEKHSLEKLYKSSFYVRLNRLSKARRLGLIPLPRELREIILSKVYMPPK